MALSETDRQNAIVGSRIAARAFAEDMSYMRDVIGRFETSRGEIRRISAILRRLLTENDLALLARPRIGKLQITAPDNNPILKVFRDLPIEFFCSGGGTIFGIQIRAALVGPTVNSEVEINPEQIVTLSLENFLKQKVLCIDGEWATRHNVISYVANKASGVHSGIPRTKEDFLLERISKSMSITLDKEYNVIKIVQNLTNGIMPIHDTFILNNTNVDPVLYEILSTVSYLCASPEISVLETMIRAEHTQQSI